MAYAKLPLITLALAGVLVQLASAAPVGANDCGLRSAVRADLLAAWDQARPALIRDTARGLADGNPNALYLLEEYTHPFIGAARDCGMDAQLSQLANVYNRPFDALSETTRGAEHFSAWLCSGPDCPSWPSKGNPKPFEVILYSAQFLYGASALINAVSLVPDDQRTADERKLLGRATYIADTYARWLSSSGDPLYPQGVRAATEKLLHNKARTDDKQLQIAGGIVELLCAAQRESDGLGISTAHTRELRSYADLYWQLIQSRAHFDSDGRVGYDEAWGTIDRAKSASYTGAEGPSLKQSTGVQSLSLDLGHFARVPEVVESYQRCGFADGKAILEGMARQFADRVWNGDSASPRFYNYFSGAGMRGWYNRTFDKAGKVKSKGWAPTGLSDKGPAYFFLARYDAKVGQISEAYYKANPDKLTLKPSSDQQRVLYLLYALPGFVD